MELTTSKSVVTRRNATPSVADNRRRLVSNGPGRGVPVQEPHPPASLGTLPAQLAGAEDATGSTRRRVDRPEDRLVDDLRWSGNMADERRRRRQPALNNCEAEESGEGGERNRGNCTLQIQTGFPTNPKASAHELEVSWETIAPLGSRLIHEAAVHDKAVGGPVQVLQGEVRMVGPKVVVPAVGRIGIDGCREKMNGGIAKSETNYARVHARPFRPRGEREGIIARQRRKRPSRPVRKAQPSSGPTLEAGRAVVSPVGLGDPYGTEGPVGIALADHDGVAGAVGDAGQFRVERRAAFAADFAIGWTEDRPVAHIVAKRVAIVPNVEARAVDVRRAPID